MGNAEKTRSGARGDFFGSAAFFFFRGSTRAASTIAVTLVLISST
ncbi:hypothetical protein [Rhizobium laguerreae]|nr:hypothetical protein [Rhizobium laguerreae]